ncbi:MAG: hypothetical protein CMP65_04960 [Flavobacteriales bacterium]|nr:hypothetical protein [Flavobacteriales bacterium]|tara:strand:- start:3747 stop:5189 length:1443 start_codon:yes stop_codon:yes gene_type:complete
MKKKFITNLVLVIFLNLLIKPFYILGIDAEVINQVGAKAYGNYFALINFSFILNIILDLGITNFNVKNIAQHHQLLDKHFSGIITIRLILVIIYCIATLLLAILVGYNSLQIKLLIILAINQSLVAFILYIRSNLSGLHLFFQDSLISILDRTLLILICSLLLWGGITSQPFQIEWFVYSQTLAYFITLIVCFLLVFSKTNKFTFKWNTKFALVILKQSFPYALLILLMTIYYRIDSVMLERMLNDQSLQAGIYAQAYRFFEASNMIAYLFAALLLPIFSRMIKLNQSIVEIVNFSFKLLMGFVLTLAVFCCIFNYNIIDFRYDAHIEEASKILSVLMICFLFVSSTYIFGTLLTANGNLYHLNLVAGIGVVINITLNILLIPKYQALGSAFASLITQFLTGVAQIILCCHFFNLNLKKTLSQILIFLIGLFLFAFFLKCFYSFTILNLLLYLTFSFIWLFISKLVKISDFHLLISTEIK